MPWVDPQAEDEKRKRNRRLAELGKRKGVKVLGNPEDGFTIGPANDLGKVLAFCRTLDDVEGWLAAE